MSGVPGLAILVPLITAVISAAVVLISVVVGSWLTDRREREKQRRDYITRQLSELYGPLLSLRWQVTARHEFRDKTTSAVDKMWDDLRPEMRRAGAADKTIVELHTSDRDKLTDYDQHALKEIFLPDYHEMLTLMRKNIWLAEQTTRANFDALIEYVDTWDMFVNGVIKGGVVRHLGQGEAKLLPFYNDVEQIHDRLRSELATRRKPAFSTLMKTIPRRL
jgi:hypothetical protein